MHDARATDAWNHTSTVLALLANAHRDTRKKPAPFKPSDFHPCREARQRERPLPVEISVLKTVFVDRKR
jgi:hypothetical protein